MQINELWSALESDLLSDNESKSGWLLRLARPAADCPIYVGLELATKRRALLLRLPSESVTDRRYWPRCMGLEPVILTIGGITHLGVALKEIRFADVFAALADDLIRSITDVDNSEEQGRVFLAQLARWQKMLSISCEDMSEEAQRGLWGELFILREYLALQ